MMINNSDINITNVNQKAVAEKVSPVQAVSPTADVTSRGNDLPAEAATLVGSSELQKNPDAEKLDEAVRDINEHMQVVQHELHFSIDKDSGQTVIKVMDLATKEVIRQIPNEEALNIARELGEGDDVELFSEYI